MNIATDNLAGHRNLPTIMMNTILITLKKGKVIPLQTWCGPEGG